MKTPIWPYIAVVACLFALSLLAPRAWLRDPPAPPPVSNADDEVPSVTVTTPHAVSASELSEAGNVDHAEPIAFTAPIADSPRVQTEDSQSDLNVLFGGETPAEFAPIQPPVAEQIKLDVSIKETPALPIVESGPAKQAVSDLPREEPQPTEVAETDGQSVVEPQAPAVTKVKGIVPRPTLIIDALSELSYEPECADWARQISSRLERIHTISSFESPELPELFQELFEHLKETPQLAQQTQQLERRAKILRVGYATKRRVDIWYQVHRIMTNTEISVPDTAGMNDRLRDVEERLDEAEFTQEWSNYLLLPAIRSAIDSTDTDARREIAKRVLKRIDSPQLSAEQAEVLEKPPFDEFTLELRRWSSETIDYVRLLEQIEEYEQTGSTESATSIATCYDVVRWSAHSQTQLLGQLLNTHYRNANVRVALTSEFLNRLLPDPQAYQQDVNGMIAGADVYGTSQTVNRLQVVLHPDGQTWRIGLEAHGEVASDTAASKGPATFYNQGFSRYHARKLLMIDRRGIRVWRAEADANSETELTGFETDFDPIPILGWLARSVARSQHDQQYYNAKADTEAMVRNQATSRFDEEVHDRLGAAEQRVKQKLIRPFEKIDLKPTALDMSTTEQRVIARYRLAADEQLGAQTPRPQAPSDSLLSVQIHESALNNTLANLKLEGKRIGLRELYQQLADTFEHPELEIPEDIPENVTIQFADEEAVRVRCDNGRVMLTIRIAELKDRRFKFTDFFVRAFYAPASDQLNANLVRDGFVQIGNEPRCVVLRTIFSKVLSQSRPFNLINKRLSENPHLTDCHVNQFVINDGWIGVGIGPDRAEQLDQLAKQKEDQQQR